MVVRLIPVAADEHEPRCNSRSDRLCSLSSSRRKEQLRPERNFPIASTRQPPTKAMLSIAFPRYAEQLERLRVRAVAKREQRLGVNAVVAGDGRK